MQLQTTVPESKFPNECSGVIFIQIDQHLKKLLKKYKGSRFYDTRCSPLKVIWEELVTTPTPLNALSHCVC